MIIVERANRAQEVWIRWKVSHHHYLRSWPDSRGCIFPYAVRLALPSGERPLIGALVFGRPEGTACYDSKLTFGSVQDVATGKARYSRWELLNLARVWLRPVVQAGGPLCRPELLPGYIHKDGSWRSALASETILAALDRIVFDYLLERPPCFLEEPYQIREVISYCDTRKHSGVIYQQARFRLVRTNEEGVQTWAKQVRSLMPDEDALVRLRAEQSPRSREKRAARAAGDIRQLAITI